MLTPCRPLAMVGNHPNIGPLCISPSDIIPLPSWVFSGCCDKRQAAHENQCGNGNEGGEAQPVSSVRGQVPAPQVWGLEDTSTSSGVWPQLLSGQDYWGIWAQRTVKRVTVTLRACGLESSETLCSIFFILQVRNQAPRGRSASITKLRSWSLSPAQSNLLHEQTYH